MLIISIIIPFYNTEKYFDQCLSSIKAQTFLDYEVLLIDDGSTDSSRQIAQQYADSDERFILLNDTHIGYPACKNLGLDKAKGQYICFIDSDDCVEKFHLENLYNALITTDSDIASCKHYAIHNDEFSFTNKPYLNDYRVLGNTLSILRQYFPNTYPWNKLFKKSLFDGLRFRNVEALSDTLINCLILERAKRVVRTGYRSYHYRIRNNSITYNARNYSTTYWPFRVNTYIEVCSYVCKYKKLIHTARNLMKTEWNYCYPHLTEAQKEEFNNNTSLQRLLHNV